MMPPIQSFFSIMLAGAISLCSTLASAQDREASGPPQGLKPATNPNYTEQPAPSDADGQTIGSRPGMRDGGIQIGTLSRITDSNVGLMTEATGGFASSLWEGTDRIVLESLLPKLPTASPSKTMNDLSRRLILSTAAVPSGVTSGNSILEMRLERLANAALFQEIIDLTALVPSVETSTDIAKHRAQAFVATNRISDACKLAASVKNPTDQAFWLQLRTVCYVVAKENPAADLTAGLLREQGNQDETFFALTTQATSGAKSEIPSPDSFSVLHMALFVHLEEAPDLDLLFGAPPFTHALIAAEERFATEARLYSALKGEGVGVTSIEQIASLMDAVDFSQEELTAPLTNAAKLAPQRGMALLYRALKTSTVPSSSAELLKALFTTARQNAQLPTISRLIWPIARGLIPSEAFSSVATDLSRMALINQDQALGLAWFNLARQDKEANPNDLWDLRVLLASLAPNESLSWRTTEPLDWLNDANSPSLFNRRVREIVLLEGLGYPINRQAQTVMLKGSANSFALTLSPVIRTQLQSASVGQRVGETLLLTLSGLGKEGPGAFTPVNLLEIQSALTTLNMQKDAQNLLFDAILSAQSGP